MKKIKIILFSGIIIFLLIYSWYIFQMNKVYELPARELYVEQGLGVKQISADLEATGFIPSDFLFRTYVWQKGLENKFYAGHYKLPEKISMKGLVNILTGNNSYTPSRQVTIIEGWNIPQIASYLETEAGIYKEDFYKLVGYPIFSAKNKNGLTVSKDYSAEFSFLKDKPSGYGLEGYLFPDTYKLTLEADAEDVVRKMLENFDKKFTPQMRQEVIKQGRTIYETVTVASILERELKTLDEKKLGAGIIYKRLQLGMPLQMDSTINYLTGKNTPQATKSDLKIDSPYNTYKYKGLPPGPISNPGIDSLRAAVYPIDSDYLYFLTDSQGRAHFSKTYDEHLYKKSKYLD